MAEEWGYADKTTGESSYHWFKSSGILELFYKHRHCINELYSEIGGFNLDVLGVGIEPIEWLIEREGHEIVLQSDCGNEIPLNGSKCIPNEQEHISSKPINLIPRPPQRIQVQNRDALDGSKNITSFNGVVGRHDDYPPIMMTFWD
jgi:hypothetical protein